MGGQSTSVGEAFAKPLAARVTDAYNNAIPGITVTFALPPWGASATFAGGGTSVGVPTDATGVATSPTLTANWLVVSHTPTPSASVAGVANAAIFALRRTLPSATTISATGGTPQSTTVNTQFAQPLEATVTDPAGRPIEGVTATFTEPTTRGTFQPGGAGTFVTTTNAAGKAVSAPILASGTKASWSATVRGSGGSRSAAISLTNQ